MLGCPDTNRRQRKDEAMITNCPLEQTRRGRVLPWVMGLVIAAAGTAGAQTTELKSPIAAYLESGKLAEGERAMRERVSDNPADQQARFGLGVIQFLRAVEHLAQGHYRYGLLQHRFTELPLTRLPVPPNPNPEEISYEKARELIRRFLGELKTAEATLAQVEPAGVRLPINLRTTRLDLDGNGTATDKESLASIYLFVSQANRVPPAAERPQQRGEFQLNWVVFDGGDVHWLRGYCHLLMAIGDMALAYDWKELFERTGHLIYPRVESPYQFLRDEARHKQPRSFDPTEILDSIAAIHLFNFPVADKARMLSALNHLEAVVRQSRLSWKLYLAETDDELEWIPNPKQTGVLANVRVQGEMVEAWYGFLDEFEAILQGKKLVPFWRGGRPSANAGSIPVHPTLGINLRRVFTEPRRFDLVLWVQGTAAQPYLEEGPITKPQFWRQLQQVFRGRFVGFAVWFN